MPSILKFSTQAMLIAVLPFLALINSYADNTYVDNTYANNTHTNNTYANNTLPLHLEGWHAGYPALMDGRAISNAKPILQAYEDRDFKPFWLEGNTLNTAARELFGIIKTIDHDGLFSQDYHSTALTPYFSEESQKNFIPAELLLTDALLTLARHLLNGKVNPTSLVSEAQPTTKPFNDQALLARLNDTDAISRIIESLRPNHIRYHRLAKALDTLRNTEYPTWNKLALATAIKPGQRDSRIEPIVERLRFWGDFTDTGVATDTYDQALASAIEKFQSRHGLNPDRVIGQATLKALNITPAQRIRDIMVNMERWRWLDQNFGNYFIIVNIADFNLRIYSDNELVFQKPVIVGRHQRKTPAFSNTIRYIVFNPTWTVPKKLAIEDKLPEIKKDKTYLSRLGFTLYQNGSVVDPRLIDWDSFHKDFPFKLVQAPGPLNALGQVKFMFPNPYDVYLHDTPSKELFKHSARTFSSGCIRLSDPIELAQRLLKPQGIDLPKIQGILASKETTTIYLDTPVPIHLEYWTAWVDRAGTLNFREDIYERDQGLFNALSKPL